MENEYLDYFVKNHYTMVKSYINIGIFYVEDANLIALGPFGGNKLQIKCKNANCDESLIKFEELLRNLK